MAEELGQSRTEAPTPRRREEARQQGQVAFSRELTSAVVLLAGIAALTLAGQATGRALLEQTRLDLLHCRTDLGSEEAEKIFFGLFGRGLELIGLLLGMIVAAGVGVGVMQAGFYLTPELLSMNWSRLNPAANSGRLFSFTNLWRGIAAVLKVALVALLAWWVLRGRLPAIAVLNETTLSGVVAQGWGLVARLTLAVAGGLVLVGLLDYGWQKWRFESALWMTRQELKEEIKREEGDPEIKGRLRRLQRESARRKMFDEVPSATVVVTNPTHLAIALRYDRGTMAAPKVVAKGAGLVAKRIADLARRHAVPVVERKEVARALFRTAKVGQEIPAALYYAIAEILAYIYRLRAA